MQKPKELKWEEFYQELYYQSDIDWNNNMPCVIFRTPLYKNDGVFLKEIKSLPYEGTLTGIFQKHVGVGKILYMYYNSSNFIKATIPAEVIDFEEE